jgi:hypothetical protein
MAAKTALDRIKKQIDKLRRDPIGSVGDATSAVLDHLQQLGEHQLSLLDAQSSKLAMMIESKTGLPEAATRKLHDMQQAVSQSLSSAREALMHIGEARGQVSRLIGDAAETLSQSPLGKVPPARSALSKVRKLAGGKRVENVEDVLSVGQKLLVRITKIDDRGKLSLEPVQDAEENAAPAQPVTTPA